MYKATSFKLQLVGGCFLAHLAHACGIKQPVVQDSAGVNEDVDSMTSCNQRDHVMLPLFQELASEGRKHKKIHDARG